MPVPCELDIPTAWDRWWAADSIQSCLILGVKVIWLARIGKLLQTVAGCAILIELTGREVFVRARARIGAGASLSLAWTRLKARMQWALEALRVVRSAAVPVPIYEGDDRLLRLISALSASAQAGSGCGVLLAAAWLLAWLASMGCGAVVSGGAVLGSVWWPLALLSAGPVVVLLYGFYRAAGWAVVVAGFAVRFTGVVAVLLSVIVQPVLFVVSAVIALVLKALGIAAGVLGSQRWLNLVVVGLLVVGAILDVAAG